MPLLYNAKATEVKMIKLKKLWILPIFLNVVTGLCVWAMKGRVNQDFISTMVAFVIVGGFTAIWVFALSRVNLKNKGD